MCLVLLSCQKTNTKRIVDHNNSEVEIITQNKSSYKVYEWQYKEHTYILIERSNGSGITHAGHCICQNEE
jgi:hypothetical protein